MCNYSQYVFEKGFQEGFPKGFEEGFQEGLQQSIFILISTLLEMGSQKAFIVSKVAEKFQLTLEAAQNYYTEYLHSHS